MEDPQLLQHWHLLTQHTVRDYDNRHSKYAIHSI